VFMKHISLKIVVALAVGLVSSLAQAKPVSDCITVLSAWQAGTAFTARASADNTTPDSNDNGSDAGFRVALAIAAVAGAVLAARDQHEIDMIQAARSHSTTAALSKLYVMVNANLAKRHFPRKATWEEFYAGIDSASRQQLICHGWSGAMIQKSIASNVGLEIIKNSPEFLRASQTPQSQLQNHTARGGGGDASY
jgi:hypothetical protein